MGWLSGFGVTHAPDRARARSPSTTRRRSGRSRCASTAVTSSTATRTAWRSASAASSARACARRSASTCAAPTTRPTRRCRPASATASSTRSTTCGASTATSASRRAHRGDHRDQALRVLVRQPRGRDLHQAELLVDDDGRARRQPWELWLGDEDDAHQRVDARHRALGPGGLRGSRRLVGRARLRRAPARGRPVGDRGRIGRAHAAARRSRSARRHRSTPAAAALDDRR